LTGQQGMAREAAFECAVDKNRCLRHARVLGFPRTDCTLTHIKFFCWPKRAQSSP
jgi:hypothetical protein